MHPQRPLLLFFTIQFLQNPWTKMATFGLPSGTKPPQNTSSSTTWESSTHQKWMVSFWFPGCLPFAQGTPYHPLCCQILQLMQKDDGGGCAMFNLRVQRLLLQTRRLETGASSKSCYDMFYGLVGASLHPCQRIHVRELNLLDHVQIVF